MFALRPASNDDDEPVLRVLAERDLNDFGVADFTRSLLVDQWRVGEFDPIADAVVACDGETVIGYGAVFTPGALAFVAPAHEAKGVGSALLAWAENRARELGRDTHRQPLAERNAGARTLLASAGYRRVRSVVQMRRALGPRYPARPPVPDGITLDGLEVERDARALHAADIAAFAGNPEFEPESFEAFCDEHLGSPELDPTLSQVARRGKQVAGFTVCRRSGPRAGYIDLLAVDPSERRRGLGTVLLLSAFGSFARAGLHEARLEVASDNLRAVRLYEQAGMIAHDRVDVFEKPEPQAAAGSPSGSLK